MGLEFAIKGLIYGIKYLADLCWFWMVGGGRKGDSMMNCPPLLYLILDFEKYCLCVLGQLLTTIRQHKMDRR